MTFFCVDLSKESGDQLPFATYLFEVEANGFRKVQGNCRDDFVG